MKVFLTGGTGFIGQAIVRTMRGRGWEVHALVRDVTSAPARWLAEKGCTLTLGDVTRREGLVDAMASVDMVMHNAGVYELGADAATRERMQQVNVNGTDHVLGASLQAGVARTVFVSSVVALGASSYAPEPSVVRDETHHPDGRHLSPYNRSKAEAHQVALAWRARGLSLIIAMPNAVVGANDHSIFGYFLRMYLAGVMPPVAFGGDAMLALVDVDALAEGLCLAAERASIGEDYIFSGEAITGGAIIQKFARFPGGMKVRLQLPRWFMRPQMLLLEPLQRAVGMPAVLSRDAVDQSLGHFNYSSAKARRDLGWTHPGTDEMWDRIIRRERELMAERSGLRNKLRHQSVVDDAGNGFG